MKPLITAIVALLILGATPHAANAANFPMTCVVSSNPIKMGTGDRFEIHFRKTHGPAVNGVKPGECTFNDRAITAAEPSDLCVKATLTSLLVNGGFSTFYVDAAFGGPAGPMLNALSIPKATLENLTVHTGGPGVDGAPCFEVDSYGV